jgi:hypothetical protein
MLTNNPTTSVDFCYHHFFSSINRRVFINLDLEVNVPIFERDVLSFYLLENTMFTTIHIVVGVFLFLFNS